MKFGYMCPYNKLGCGESEARDRIKYCLKKLGHEVIELDSQNYDFIEKKYAENLELDCLLSHCVVEQKNTVFPDIFSCFFYWCPSEFLSPDISIDYITYMNKHDCIVGGYESEFTNLNLSNTKFFKDTQNLINFCASIPKDWIIPPQKRNTYKLFYVGMNVGLKARYLELIEFLDKQNLIDIYGPQKAFGKKNRYSKFKSYKGDIPFDGKSILGKINEAGICLALNSNVHSSVNYVSNRIYEAAASGAIIICDKNKYIEKYFGDSVFYIDITSSEKEIQNQIINILNYIKANPTKAYEMAIKSQEIFKEKLTLDSQVENLVKYINTEKIINNKNNTKIDIICEIENKNDYDEIYKEITKQYIKNIKLIIISPTNLINEIHKNIEIEHIFIQKEDSNGYNYSKALHLITSDYFMFMNKHSKLHSNHILKNIKAMDKKSLFSYSGTYLKENYNYTTLNNEQISKNSFLKFLNNYPESSFKLEETIALSSLLFKTSLLKYTKTSEIKQINSSPHIYLILCSIIKAKKLGNFSYALTSGYKNINNPKNLFKQQRKIYLEENRSKNLLQYELKKVFIKYPIDFPAEIEANTKIRKEILKIIKLKIKLSRNYLILKKFFTLKKEKKEKLKFKITEKNNLLLEIK